MGGEWMANGLGEDLTPWPPLHRKPMARGRVAARLWYCPPFTRSSFDWLPATAVETGRMSGATLSCFLTDTGSN